MKRVILLMICMSICLCCALNAQAATGASLTVSTSAASGYGGDEITLSIRMTASAMGGLQTNLTWNTGYLTYVEDSAAFADAFKSSAMIAQVNAQAGCLRLLYASTAGYTAQDEVIFTAKFRLTEGVNGTTSFSLADTKMTDAATSVNAMDVTVQGADVYTQVYDPGTVWTYLSGSDQWPMLGDTVTVQLAFGTSGPAIGSVQGTISYDPAILALEADGAAFTDEAEAAAFTKSLNMSEDGQIQFVYAAMDGCPSSLMELRFQVVGGVNDSTVISVSNLKATNADAAHLSAMECYTSSLLIWPQPAENHVYYTLKVAPGTTCADEVLTLALYAKGSAFGGLQGTLTYDASQLEYVSGSAAFTDDFAQSADVKLINAAQAGQIQLVYASAEGYAPSGDAIMTVQFRLLEDTNLSPVELTGLKTTTDGSSDVQEIPCSFIQGVDWSQSVLGHTWDSGVVTKKPTTTAQGVITYTCASCGSTRTETIPVRIPGDADDDGKVDLYDALRVLEYGGGENVAINLYNADVNGDGKVDIHDALKIMQYDAGWNVNLL